MDKEVVKQLERMIEVVVRSIPKERQAHDAFLTTAQEARSEMIQVLFSRLAEQEEQHEAKLRAALEILQQELNDARGKPVAMGEGSLAIHSEDMPEEEKCRDVEKVMEVVMRMIPKERAAAELYSSTASSASRELTKKLFEMLAAQEQEHENKLIAILDLLKQEMNRIKCRR
ncbi:hypothetical protein LLH00_01435 [bacterium]|nr:hypothetical protein [bacterium]